MMNSEKLILQKLDEVTDRLSGVEAGQQETNTRLEAVEASQSETNTRLEAVEASQSETNTRLEAVETSQAKMDTRLGNVETELETFTQQMQAGFQEVNQRLNKVEHNIINGLGPYFENVEKHVDQKTDEVKDSIESHDRILDTLSSRTIRHESEIKKFKKE